MRQKLVLINKSFIMNQIIAASLAYVAVANNVPIMGSYPGWVQGQGRTGIVVEIFLDLMCSDSQANNPIWNQLLQTEWLDGTVSDQVMWAYTPMPLPYHIHAFQVTQIVPYLQDLCITDSTQCLTNQYKDFCFEQLDMVEAEHDVSQDDFIAQWTGLVAARFNLD